MFESLSKFMDILFADGTLFEYIGYAAAVGTIAAFVIQSLRILTTKNISGLSSYMYTMYSLALICWFAYGVYIESWVLAISNLITFFFTFIILLQIIYYDEEDKIERFRRDPLTWVFNRDYYNTYLPDVLAESRARNVPFCILTAKIANLDTIYNSMGGKYKNRTLKRTAKALENALRGNDFVARIDDNEFAIYIASLNKDFAKNVVSRVWEAVHAIEIKKSEKEKTNVELLVGVCSSDCGSDLDDLTKKARLALSTTQTRHSIGFYSTDMAVADEKKQRSYRAKSVVSKSDFKQKNVAKNTHKDNKHSIPVAKVKSKAAEKKS